MYTEQEKSVFIKNFSYSSSMTSLLEIILDLTFLPKELESNFY